MQTLEGVVEFRIRALPGFGRIIEALVVDNLVKVYAALPGIVRAWAEFREEALALPRGAELLLAGRPLNAGVPWVARRTRELCRGPSSAAAAAGSAPRSSSLRGAASDAETFFDAGEEIAAVEGEEEKSPTTTTATTTTTSVPRPASALARAAAAASGPLSSFLSRAPSIGGSGGPPALTALSASPLRRADPSGAHLSENASTISLDAGAEQGENQKEEEVEVGVEVSPAPAAAASPPSLPPAALWFPAAPAATTGGGPHSRRWRRFWASRRVRRAAAVPGASSKLLGCFVAPAAVEGVARGIGGGMGSVGGAGSSCLGGECYSSCASGKLERRRRTSSSCSGDDDKGESSSIESGGGGERIRCGRMGSASSPADETAAAAATAVEATAAAAAAPAPSPPADKTSWHFLRKLTAKTGKRQSGSWAGSSPGAASVVVVSR